MNLRWKIALASASVALVATTAVGVISYRSTSARLVDELDRSIASAADQFLGQPRRGHSVPTRDFWSVYSVRLLGPNGEELESTFSGDVPVTGKVKEVVGHPQRADWATTTVDGEDYRIYTVGISGGALQTARGLDEVDAVLDDVRRRTLLLVVAVSLAAAAMGWLIAGTVTAPVRRLTKAAEDVGTSGRLDVEVPGTGSDEVGRLGAAFRRMLDALALSRAEQQRLVQDAGHELRTPLTSLRTNLSVLRRHPDMDPAMQRQILDDLDSEVVELTDLVNELVTVASGDLTDQPIEALELGELASDVATRVSRRRSRAVTVSISGDSSGRTSIVNGPRAGLDRAIANLIDNACKFDETGGSIEVVVDAGSLTVLDRGPGIPETDLTKVFDRFHRADTARAMPGSGLGLAIVRDVVERMDGTVRAENRPGGGLSIGFDVPIVDPSAARSPAAQSPAAQSPVAQSPAVARPIEEDVLFGPPSVGTATPSAHHATPPSGV
ncbi:MAG: HAMP domain-containing sensor histidine kinase [Ilumatobacteraceae bacterium]